MEVNMGNIRETFFANQLFKPNEVFVFGSNLASMHGGGAARIARMYFGAVMGNGDGMQASPPMRSLRSSSRRQKWRTSPCPMISGRRYRNHDSI